MSGSLRQHKDNFFDENSSLKDVELGIEYFQEIMQWELGRVDEIFNFIEKQSFESQTKFKQAVSASLGSICKETANVGVLNAFVNCYKYQKK